MLFIASLLFHPTVVVAQWALTGNNLVGGEKLGSLNNFPVNIFTNGSNRLSITTSGRVGIGTTSPAGILAVKGTTASHSSKWVSGGTPLFVGYGQTTAGNSDLILSMASTTANVSPVMYGRRSRGTLGTPAVVASNDYLLSLVGSGYDGTNFQNSSALDFFADGTPTAGNVPVRISLATGSNAANRTERLKIGSTGDISLNNNQLFLKQSDGRIGVGTVTPTARLQVVGGNTTAPAIAATVTYVGSTDVRGVSSTSKPADGWGYGVEGTGGFIGGLFAGTAGAYGGTGYGVFGNATGTAGTRIGVYGTASGGTVNNWGGYFPTKTYTSELRVGGERGAVGYVASINGKLIATEVRVELTANWPDYVFDKGYKLMTLEALEAKINAEKHLPGIPAASEVKEGGIMLGEMQTKTMEKVEENTLYIIQLNNKIKELEKIIDNLSKKIK
jgi:hypothetical protein